MGIHFLVLKKSLRHYFAKIRGAPRMLWPAGFLGIIRDLISRSWSVDGETAFSAQLTSSPAMCVCSAEPLFVIHKVGIIMVHTV